MSELIDLLTRVDPNLIGQDAETVIYGDADVRSKATHIVELAGHGLLAVLEHDEGTSASFVVLGDMGTVDGVVVWYPVFRGWGPSGPGLIPAGGDPTWRGLRELRHTYWGENGYLHYPPGALISDAFAKLERWFDCGAAELASLGDRPRGYEPHRWDLPTPAGFTRLRDGRIQRMLPEEEEAA